VVAGQTISRTPEDIWEDLQRVPRDVLEGKDELTGEPRGIWTSLDLSYNVLPEPEQTMFRRMCILLSPASIEDIAAITETPNPRPILDALIGRSLVRTREGAYSLLPIVRDYAQGKFADTDEDPRELHARAANHYGQKNTLEDALTACDHLFELAVRFHLRVAAEEFVEYVRGFYDDMVRRGYWAKARSKTEQVLIIARALGDKKAEALVTGEWGIRYFQIGEYERAEELYREAQRLANELGDKRGVASALHSLGMLAQAQGNYGEAARLYDESLEIMRELSDKRGIATVQHLLGTLAQARGDYDKAARLYGESLEGVQELRYKSGIASSLHQLGVLAQNRGDYDEAARLYGESLEINKKLEFKSGIAITLHQLGTLAQDQGDYGKAEQLYSQGLEIAQELDDKSGVASSFGQLGRLSVMRGRMKEALNYFLKAFLIFEELNAPDCQMALMDIAVIRETLGEEQFTAWLRKLSPEAERISALLEQQTKQVVEHLSDVARAVAAARKRGNTEERDELAQQLTRMETGAREQNAVGVAEFFALMRGLLAGEDVAEKFAALDEPLKGIAEQALAARE